MEFSQYLRDHSDQLAAKKADLEAAGFPSDLEQLELYCNLDQLAAEFQTTQNPEALVEYQETVQALVSLGWRGTIPSSSRLSDEFMPEEYLSQVDSY